MSFVLLVQYEEWDSVDPTLLGPFLTVEGAQVRAEAYRREMDLPVEATPENNDAWTDMGWYFGIKELSR